VKDKAISAPSLYFKNLNNKGKDELDLCRDIKIAKIGETVRK
jgi:hypothetical protein